MRRYTEDVRQLFELLDGECLDGGGHGEEHCAYCRATKTVESLANPSFREFVDIAQGFLVNYPEEVFTGSNSDSGSQFVASLRNAVNLIR